jgi:arylsulfatase A-like enzyme
MKRTSTLLSLAAASLFFAQAPGATAAESRPNIVIILTDDSALTDVGCYGGEIDTPNIDALARGGLRFANFYTNARCSPTRATLMTGRDCALAGFAAGTLGQFSGERQISNYRGRLAGNLPTLAELLRDAGYRTMMAGKWHLGGGDMRDSESKQAAWKKRHSGWELPPAEIGAEFNAMPAQRGFGWFFGLLGGETDFFFLPGDKQNYLEGNRPAELSFERTYTIDGADHKKGGAAFRHLGKTAKAFYDTDGITDRVLEKLRGDAAAGGDKPFFLYLAYRAPHAPVQAPKELVDKYLPRFTDFNKVAAGRHAGLVREGLFPASAAWRSEPAIKGDPDGFRKSLAVHAAMVEKVDENVGRLTGALKELGQLENTLIFYLSDNGAAPGPGPLLNKPYEGAKGLLWEGGARTHCIAHWPARIQPGGIARTIGWVADFLPTCVELAGAKPVPTEGRSLVPVLAGGELPPPEDLFFNDGGQQSVVHQGRWKLLINPGWYVSSRKQSGDVLELYDLDSDPAETKNVVSDHPEVANDLKARCEAWQKKCGIVDYSQIYRRDKGE